MTLLDFLRKTNTKGHILEHIQKAYRKAPQTMSLEAFARSYRTFGEKIIAAEMVSMLNDKLLGCRVGRPRGLSQDRNRTVCRATTPVFGESVGTDSR